MTLANSSGLSLLNTVPEQVNFESVLFVGTARNNSTPDATRS